MNTKVVVVVVSAMVVMTAGIGAFIYLNNSDKGFDFSELDGSQIKNYSNYKYFGAGKATSQKTPSTSNIISAPEDGDVGAKLMGVTKDNVYEEISWIKDGKTIDPDLDVLAYQNRGFYSLILLAEEGQFQNVDNSIASTLFMAHETNDSELNDYIRMYNNIGTSYLYGSHMPIYSMKDIKDCHAFIMDNKTGNIYGFEELATKLKYDDTMYSRLYFYENTDMDDYCIVNYESAFMGKQPSRLVMKMSFNEDSLVLETVLNSEQASRFGYVTAADIYGNLYRNTHSMPNPQTEYIPNSTIVSTGDNLVNAGELLFYNAVNKVFKKITDVQSLRIAFDHRMYKVSGNEYQGFVNADGEIEDLSQPFTYPQGTWFHDGSSYYCASDSTIYCFDNVGNDLESFMAAMSGSYSYDGAVSWLETDNGLCSVSNGKIVIFSKADRVFDVIDTGYSSVTLTQSKNRSILNVGAVDDSTLMGVKGYLDTAKTGNDRLVMEELPEDLGGYEIYILTPINR